jgi:signal peptidase II
LKSLRTAWALFVTAVVTLIVDQVTKFFATTYLATERVWAPVPSLAHILTFTYTTNTGVAFGMFKNLGPIFMGVAIVVIITILIYQRQVPAEAWPIRIVLGLMLGGAVGNLVDRLRFNFAVVDFIHLHYYTPQLWLDWPVFNVADASIVIGVILLAFIMLREGREPIQSKSQMSESTESSPPTSA